MAMGPQGWRSAHWTCSGFPSVDATTMKLMPATQHLTIPAQWRAWKIIENIMCEISLIPCELFFTFCTCQPWAHGGV